jgi:hypothetical protein
MLNCTSAAPHAVHHTACGCGETAPRVARRSMLAAAGALMGTALLGRQASAASGDYEAMLVNCIDPRFTTSSLQHMTATGMRDRYSQFVIAGGPIGAVHQRFAPWHGAFWDNLDITVQLHNIKRVVALTHRDCGAAKLAFGDAAVATRQSETAAHAEALRAFAAEVRRRKPTLAVVAGIMDLNGSVDAVS